MFFISILKNTAARPEFTPPAPPRRHRRAIALTRASASLSRH